MGVLGIAISPPRGATIPLHRESIGIVINALSRFLDDLKDNGASPRSREVLDDCLPELQPPKS